ncbi:hypothetical protein FOG18_01655 [Legionella israelensis]|uniref:hypothetical protein n=1 Tax=Legionella israelensis TaxID=454 RepID=UPI00117F1DDB|nr:hypothetical protein [Legionella israelensis]QDP71374.1 hypothetical protein FOG18_01655 [Legionella israelensis]
MGRSKNVNESVFDWIAENNEKKFMHFLEEASQDIILSLKIANDFSESSSSENQLNLLDAACLYDRYNFVEILLETELFDKEDFFCALKYAVLNNNNDVLEKFNGKSISLPNLVSLISLAAYEKHFEVFELLFQKLENRLNAGEKLNKNCEEELADAFEEYDFYQQIAHLFPAIPSVSVSLIKDIEKIYEREFAAEIIHFLYHSYAEQNKPLSLPSLRQIFYVLAKDKNTLETQYSMLKKIFLSLGNKLSDIRGINEFISLALYLNDKDIIDHLHSNSKFCMQNISHSNFAELLYILVNEFDNKGAVKLLKKTLQPQHICKLTMDKLMANNSAEDVNRFLHITKNHSINGILNLFK